jgi:oligosaccharide reducing-end xylanase
MLGKAKTDLTGKVTTAVNRYFGIGTGESDTPTANTGYRVYYELPNDSTMGYIWAADSNDVRSEGMSYGMMIALQTDLHTQFDHLWNFAKKYMQITASGPLQNFFNWQGHVTGSTVSFNNSRPAPDGDQYFAAALYLADQRWGSTGAINYKQEADNIAGSFMHNSGSGSNCTLFNPSQHQVVFFPLGGSCNITDPSYHLPGFYELFALYGPSADSAAWKAQATASRAFLVQSANATTGLHPDYATFSGSPTTASAGDGHDAFQYDAWRVVMNMAIDYAWFSSDASMKAQIEKYYTFFTKYLGNGNVTQSLFNVDGSGAMGGGSTALTATLATGALASTASNESSFVNNLWIIQQQNGQFRYYQENVYLLGLLAAAGNYCYAF